MFTFVLLHNHEIGWKGYNVYKCEIILIAFSEFLILNAPFCNIFDRASIIKDECPVNALRAQNLAGGLFWATKFV